ncbi:MAG: hypothetical protein J6T10_30540 [Methanobrevibacter sp.]|nr:hypothetical protein [Methanobrevibacter sp.]
MIFLSIWPTTVAGWITLGTLTGGLIASIVKLIPTLIKLKRATFKIVKNKNFDLLRKIAMKAMAEAQTTGQPGEEKLQMVISAIKAGAKEADIEISDEDITDLIDSVKELKQFFKDMKAADEQAKK